MAGTSVDYRVWVIGGQLEAVCSCGWRSWPGGTVAKIGAHWDRHVATAHHPGAPAGALLVQAG